MAFNKKRMTAIHHILVTGADGYIGAVLGDALVKHRYEVTNLDTLYFHDAVLGRYKPSYPLLNRDIRFLHKMDLRRFDAIVHLASLSNDAIGQLNPALTEEINFRATAALVRKARQDGIKRFLFPSSCSVYGNTKETVDERSPVQPLSAYALSKIKAEQVLQSLADNHFFVGILRIPTVYGHSPKFRTDVVVNNLVASAVALGKIVITSDGSPWRPLIDVRDLSRIFIDFLRIDAKSINATPINVGFDENNYQVKDIAEKVRNVLPNCPINYSRKNRSDTRSYRICFQKFKTLFPHVVKRWPLEASIRDMIRNLQRQRYSKKDFLNGRFERITRLKQLVTERKVNAKLFWR